MILSFDTIKGNHCYSEMQRGLTIGHNG